MAKQNKNKDKDKNNKPWKQNSNKPDGNSRDTKKQGKEDSVEKMEHVASDINDSSYYYTDTQLRDQILNFSFNEFIGKGMDFRASNNVPIAYQPKPAALMAIEINPSITPTGNPTDARAMGVNLAGLRNYVDLSSDNSKSTIYSPEIVMGFILALAEFLKMASHATRAFGLLNYFNKRNYVAPEIYFRAMDIDWTDFRDNAADYRIRFNTIIAAADKMPIPLNIEALKKASNWFTTVYKDEDGPMPQEYMFVPYSTWVLDETGTTRGSVLETRHVAKANFFAGDTWDGTFNRILDILEEQVNALITSSTLQAVFSDLLRRNGLGKCPLGNVAGVPDGYEITFGKSDEIRLMVHNMFTLGAPVPQDWKHELYEYGNTGENDVWLNSESSSLIYNPEFLPTNDANGWWDDKTPQYAYTWSFNPTALLSESLISDYFVEPDAEAKVAATRLAARPKCKQGVGDNNKVCFYWNDVAMGDAYAVKMRIFTDPTVNYTIPTMWRTGDSSFEEKVNVMTDFNLGPITYSTYGVWDSDTGVTDLRQIRTFGELNYFTFLDHTFMKRMYEAEALGLYEMRK